MNLINSKKVATLSIRKLIVLLIVFVTLLFIFPSILNLGENTKTNLDSVNIEVLKQYCEKGFNCDIKNCETNVNPDCTQTEISKWISLKNYAQKCNTNIASCDVLQVAVMEAKNNPSSSGTNLGSSNNNALISEESKKDFLNSEFYSKTHSFFENYAKDKNIDVNILYSILINEGSYSNSFEKNVRFECHKFNQALPLQKKILGFSKKVPCTIKDGESFSRVSSETNYDAYLKAKAIDSELAFRSSSFGFGQIMGFNLQGYGININVNGNLDEIRSLDNQVLFFFKFLENNDIITYIQNKNFQKISELYNGKKYAENNYNNKLEDNYNYLNSQNIVT